MLADCRRVARREQCLGLRRLARLEVVVVEQPLVADGLRLRGVPLGDVLAEVRDVFRAARGHADRFPTDHAGVRRGGRLTGDGVLMHLVGHPIRFPEFALRDVPPTFSAHVGRYVRGRVAAHALPVVERVTAAVAHDDGLVVDDTEGLVEPELLCDSKDGSPGHVDRPAGPKLAATARTVFAHVVFNRRGAPQEAPDLVLLASLEILECVVVRRHEQRLFGACLVADEKPPDEATLGLQYPSRDGSDRAIESVPIVGVGTNPCHTRSVAPCTRAAGGRSTSTRSQHRDVPKHITMCLIR